MIYTDRIFDTQFDTQIFASVKTTFKIRKDVITKEGTCPIYLYITGSGKREIINTRLHVNPVNWLSKEQAAKPVDKSHFDLNLVLEHIKSKVSDAKIRYRLNNRPLTPYLLKEELAEGNHRINFISYMIAKINENKSLKSSTTRRYLSVAHNLDRYKKDVLFTEITEAFINRYRNHLLAKGCKSTTVNGNIKLIKQYLNLARRKDGITLQVDTENIQGGNTNGNRTALIPSEIRTLCRYYFDKKLDPIKQLTLGYFLFSCMTGLRLSQVQDLERHQLLSSDFSFINKKNRKDQVINLNRMARKIVEFNPDLFVKHIHANTMNEDLKRIMKNNRIHKHVSFHVARHTFATNFLRMGGKIEHLQKLLAHSKMDTTMIYVHILASEANEQIHRLDDLFKDYGFDLNLE